MGRGWADRRGGSVNRRSRKAQRCRRIAPSQNFPRPSHTTAPPHLGQQHHGAHAVGHDGAQALAVGLAKAKGPGPQHKEGDASVEDVFGGLRQARL